MIALVFQHPQVLIPFRKVLQPYPQRNFSPSEAAIKPAGVRIGVFECDPASSWHLNLDPSWHSLPLIFLSTGPPLNPQQLHQIYAQGGIAIWEPNQNLIGCSNLLKALFPSPESLAANILFRSREKYRRIVDQAPCIIVKLDEQNQIEFLNHNGLGLDVKDSLGQNFVQLIPETARPEATQAIQATRKDRSSHGFEAKLPWYQAGEREFHFVTTLSKNMEGKKGLILSGMDISPYRDELFEMQKLLEDARELIEQRAAELQKAYIELRQEVKERERANAALRYQKELIHQVLDALPLGVYLKDPQGRYQLLNQEAPRIFGLTLKQMQDKTVYDLFPQATADEFTQEDRWVKQEGKLYTKEEVIPQGQEQRKYIYGRVPLALGADKNSHILGFRLDVTEQKKMEQQLFQNQKLKSLGALSGAIAHDFNNLLFAILLNIHLAQKFYQPEKNKTDYLKRAETAGLRAKDLILQVLSFSHQSHRQCKATPIVPLLIESLHLIEEGLPAEVTLQVDFQGHDFLASAEPTEVHQVLLNLTQNSLYAMRKKGGTLRLATHIVPAKDILELPTERRQENFLRLVIEDQGEGMTEEIKQQIFEPFFTTKPKGSGAGMGLSVVHGIMSELRGVIHCTTQPDQGCRFELFFPQSRPEISTLKQQPEDPKKEPQENKKTLNNIKILLVEDQELIRNALYEHLEQKGAEVASASNATDALETWNKSGPMHLLVTDLGLPGKRGDQLALEFLKKYPLLPVIILTGYPEKIDHNFYKSQQCKVLLKPVALDKLLEAIHQFTTQVPSK